MGPAFALELTEYKVGSSEGRFLSWWRPGKRKGRLAKQLELEERQTIAAERQADAAERSAAADERSANASERSADANEDAAKSAKGTKEATWTLVGITVLIAVAGAIAEGIEQGEIATPTDRETGLPRAETVEIRTIEGPVCTSPPIYGAHQFPLRESYSSIPILRDHSLERRTEKLKELKFIKQASEDAKGLSVVGRPNHEDGVLITRLGNAIPLPKDELFSLREEQNYYLYLIPQRDDGRYRWSVSEMRILDDY